MIKRITELPEITYNSGLYGRIAAYYRAYGADYDFCRFYAAKNLLLMEYEGCFYICGDENADYDELGFFLSMRGAQVVVADKEVYRGISQMSGYTAEKLHYMQREGCDVSGNLKVYKTEEYSKVYTVLESAFGFGKEDYSAWYTDTCHRVRHNVSQLYLSEKSGEAVAAAMVLYSDNNGSFLSHVGVRKEQQKSGCGRELLDKVQRLCGGKVCLMCSGNVRDFYIRCGFTENENLSAYQMIKQRAE